MATACVPLLPSRPALGPPPRAPPPAFAPLRLLLLPVRCADVRRLSRSLGLLRLPPPLALPSACVCACMSACAYLHRAWAAALGGSNALETVSPALILMESATAASMSTRLCVERRALSSGWSTSSHGSAFNGIGEPAQGFCVSSTWTGAARGSGKSSALFRIPAPPPPCDQDSARVGVCAAAVRRIRHTRPRV